MTKKRIILTVVICILAAALIVGGIYAAMKLRQKPVNVYPISDIAMTDDMYGGGTIGGNVRTDKMQTVYLSETQQVVKVYVKEGQTVKKGDPLIDFDTSLTSLQLQRKNLEVQKLSQQLNKAKEEYNSLCGKKIYDTSKSASTTFSTTASRAYATVETDNNQANNDETENDNDKEDDNDTPEDTPTTDEPSVVTDYEKAGGSGTASDPYLYVFADGIPFDDEFVSGVLNESSEAWVVFAKCVGNSIDGNVQSAWGVHFTKNDSGHAFSFFDATKYVGGKITSPGENPGDDPIDDPIDDPVIPPDPGYTHEELQKMKAEKQQEIRELDIQFRMAQVEYKSMEAEMTEGTIFAQMDGIISALGDPETAYQDNEPVIKLSGGGGYYIEGTISELELDTVHVGQTVSIMSWETYNQYEGTVKSVSDFPSDNYGWSDGNNNVTFYPFTVFVDDSADLREYEYVELTLQDDAGDGSSKFYLEKPFILQENGKSYVYVMGENEKLELREIVTGKDLWGSYYEICSGVTMDDNIAFPYGKNVKDGAKTKLSTLDELYSY